MGFTLSSNKKEEWTKNRRSKRVTKYRNRDFRDCAGLSGSSFCLCIKATLSVRVTIKMFTQIKRVLKKSSHRSTENHACFCMLHVNHVNKLNIHKAQTSSWQQFRSLRCRETSCELHSISQIVSTFRKRPSSSSDSFQFPLSLLNVLFISMISLSLSQLDTPSNRGQASFLNKSEDKGTVKTKAGKKF